MGHNRKLVIGGVALVKAKLKYEVLAMSEVRDEIESLLIEADFLAAAPFKWVGLIIRFGLKNDFEPLYQRINKTHGDLPVSIEVDTHLLLEGDLETMKGIFRRATTEALLHIAKKFNLPSLRLEAYRSSLTP